MCVEFWWGKREKDKYWRRGMFVILKKKRLYNVVWIHLALDIRVVVVNMVMNIPVS
jgi:hypothetical protein